MRDKFSELFQVPLLTAGRITTHNVNFADARTPREVVKDQLFGWSFVGNISES